MTAVLIRAELLDGTDEDGNARVVIPYVEGTCDQHSRVRFIDPKAIAGPLPRILANYNRPPRRSGGGIR